MQKEAKEKQDVEDVGPVIASNGPSVILFFLHDGRTSNLVEAIRARKSRGSEANKVINRFNKLSTEEQQGIIDFLRSL